MTIITNKFRYVAALAVLLLAISPGASAVVNSNNAPVALSATLSESLTVSLSGATQFWDTAHGNPLTAGNASNPGNAAITVTTTWVLTPGRASVAVYAYFASATAALVGPLGPTNVGSSILEIKVGAGAFTPVSGTNVFGVAGSSLLLDTIAITGANKNSSKADVLNFNINLSTLPQLPADTYTGTLNIQAQATP